MFSFFKKKPAPIPVVSEQPPKARTPADDMRDLALSKQPERVARESRMKQEALDAAVQDIRRAAELGYFHVEVRTAEQEFVLTELKKMGYDAVPSANFPYSRVHVKL